MNTDFQKYSNESSVWMSGFQIPTVQYSNRLEYRTSLVGIQMVDLCPVVKWSGKNQTEKPVYGPKCPVFECFFQVTLLYHLNECPVFRWLLYVISRNVFTLIVSVVSRNFTSNKCFQLWHIFGLGLFKFQIWLEKLTILKIPHKWCSCFSSQYDYKSWQIREN